MAYRKTYKASVDVDVEEVLNNVDLTEKKEIFSEQLSSVLDLSEALQCYSESELIDYIRDNYEISDIFGDLYE